MAPVAAIFDLETSNFKLKLFIYVYITYKNFLKICCRFPPTADFGGWQLPSTAAAVLMGTEIIGGGGVEGPPPPAPQPMDD